MRRPDVFTLDYSHPLAQGLVFAGLGRNPGAMRYENESLPRGISALNASYHSWVFDAELGRWALDLNRVSGQNPKVTIGKLLPVGTGPTTFVFWSKHYGVADSSGYVIFGQQTNIFWQFQSATSVYVQNSSVTVPSTPIQSTEWRFWALTSNGPSGGVKEVWLNGSLLASKTGTGGTPNDSADWQMGGWSGTSALRYSGLIADPMLFRRALSPAEIALLADRTDTTLGGFIVEERPVLYFDIGGSTVDALTASNLTISAPALGAPALGQAHALIASGITVEGPVLGAPVLAQIHALTAQNFTASSPVLGAPALTQAHALTATGLTVASPALGTPTLGQVHALTASNLAISSPVLGTPALTENAPTVDNLTADTLVVGSPALGTPAIGQVHSLTSQNFATSSPVLGTPSLVENENPVDSLTTESLVVGSPVLGTPALTQIHVLGSDGLVTGSPVLGQPSMVQVHALSALGLTVGVPVLGTPAFNGSDIVLITADEVARVVSSQSRMKIVMAASRQKQVIYAVS